MDAPVYISTEVENTLYLRDTPNNKVSHFGVVPSSDRTNANELVDPFDGPSHGRYHGLLVDESSMTTTLGLNLNTISVTGAYREGRTACKHETR